MGFLHVLKEAPKLLIRPSGNIKERYFVVTKFFFLCSKSAIQITLVLGIGIGYIISLIEPAAEPKPVTDYINCVKM